MSYTSTVEEVNSTRRKFKIVVPATAIKDAFQSVSTEIQSTAEVRGFRKGKVPATLVRKFFINDITKKAADKVIQDAYSNVSKGVDFQIVSQPQIESDAQFDEHKDFEFSATVDINPKIEMQNYQGIKVSLKESLKIEIPSEVEKQIKNLARFSGKKEKDETGRPAVAGDLVNFSYKISLDGEELKNKEINNQYIDLNGNNLKEFENAIIGMKSGENKVFSLTLPENYKDSELANKTVEYNFTLNYIENLTPAEINDELVKTHLGYASLEDCRTKLADVIKNSNDDMKFNDAYEQIVEHVLNNNEFSVAESLIDSTIARAVEEENSMLEKNQKLSLEKEKANPERREWAAKQIKGILALGHIARQEAITVSDDEMFRDIVSYASRNRIDPRALIKNVGARIYDEFRGQAMIRKVVLRILELANVEYTA